MNAHTHKHWRNDVQRASDSIHLLLAEETKDMKTEPVGWVALLDTQALSWSLDGNYNGNTKDNNTTEPYRQSKLFANCQSSL